MKWTSLSRSSDKNAFEKFGHFKPRGSPWGISFSLLHSSIAEQSGDFPEPCLGFSGAYPELLVLHKDLHSGAGGEPEGRSFSEVSSKRW